MSEWRYHRVQGRPEGILHVLACRAGQTARGYEHRDWSEKQARKTSFLLVCTKINVIVDTVLRDLQNQESVEVSFPSLSDY